MSKKIIFRADGSSTTGLGHLYRLFSLVEIAKYTFDFVFLTRETSTKSVIPETYQTIIIPREITIQNEPEWLASNFSPESYTIIADGYQFIASYQKAIKVKGYSLMYIDDLAKEHMFADVVINHSPYAQEHHFSKEQYTNLALGTKHALLRPLFLEEAKHNKTIQTIDTAFVCFGGADSLNLTQMAVEAILQISNFKRTYVVLGGAYTHKEIFNLENKHSTKITIYRNLPEEKLIKVMKKCNFAVAPASTILYELSCVKMPLLSGFYVDNQELIYKGFLNNEAIYKGGNMKNYSVSDFVSKIVEILEKKKFYHQIEAQKELFDAEIALRHLSLIKEIC